MRRALIVAIVVLLVILLAGPASASLLAPTAGTDRWRAEGHTVDRVVPEDVPLVHSLEGWRALNAGAGEQVIYDLEPGYSPPEDMAHPRQSMATFVSEARTAGVWSIIAPSRTTATKVPARCGKERPAEAAYLACHFAALPADEILLQSQRLECDSSRFSSFARAAAAQARGILTIELTATAWAPCATADALVGAYRAAHEVSSSWALWGASIDADALLAELEGA